MAIQATQETRKTARQRARSSTKPVPKPPPKPSARAAPHRTIPLRLDEADADRLAHLISRRQEENSSRRVTATDVMRTLIRDAYAREDHEP